MKKICIISANPDFLGGVSLYTWNIVNYIKKTDKLGIFWIYKGEKNRVYKKDGVNFVELSSPRIAFLDEIIFNSKVKYFLTKNYFDIINPHAVWGSWLKTYIKKNGQKIIHTYHGSTYHFYKNHLQRFNIIKKMILFPLLSFSIVIEKYPWKKADKIICVSEHVKQELESIYGKRNVTVIGAGINLKQFKHRNKRIIRKKIGLDNNKIYGLYVGRGGYWTKGLDRVIKLSKEIYKLNKNYRLIVIGPDEYKVKEFIRNNFVIFIPSATREQLPYYYNAADFLLNLSRYEGGDPTLTTGEAMASGCLICCSKDSKQEIIKDGVNGLIIVENYGEEADRILKILKNQKQMKSLINLSSKTINNYSVEKIGEKYLKELIGREQ